MISCESQFNVRFYFPSAKDKKNHKKCKFRVNSDFAIVVFLSLKYQHSRVCSIAYIFYAVRITNLISFHDAVFRVQLFVLSTDRTKLPLLSLIVKIVSI